MIRSNKLVANLIKLSSIMPFENIQDYKIHLASTDGQSEPLDIFLIDKKRWIGWNEYKPQTNAFNRKYIISFVNVYYEKDTWLFSGIYEVSDIKDDRYVIHEMPLYNEFIGRLKVTLKFCGRNRRLNFETVFDEMYVKTILEEPVKFKNFKSYNSVSVSYADLKFIIDNQLPDWHTALQNIYGVYLIKDKNNGKEYVGSACGGCGIWNRWKDYVADGHGGNKELKKIVKDKGFEYIQNNFHYTLLEQILNTASNEYVISRENYWKEVLLSRKFGYNSN